MAHSVAVGISESGKTTLMKQVALQAKRERHGVLVLDPNYGQWDADFITTDLEKFLRVAKASRRCMCMIDESGEAIARLPEAVWLGTRARHWGHHCIFGMHQWTQLLPAIRNQCTTAYVFNQVIEEAVMLSRHFNDLELRKAATLRQGEFIHKQPFLPAKICKLRL